MEDAGIRDTADRSQRVDVMTLACGGAIALSAFLLFILEPMVGLGVLPVFGGVPATWATVLCFFQAVLVLGYLYGHLSITRLGARSGAILHIAVAAVALVATLMAPARYAGLIAPDLPVALNLLGMLALTVGPAAFLMTTTTPLVSSWYAARRGGDGADPYWLYALSNAGSLLALLAYPLLVEPAVGLTSQHRLWLAGFSALCLLLAVIAVDRIRRARPSPVQPARAAPARTAGMEISRRRRATWVLLAAIPSGLLAAVTNFITTDLISAPLLWVGPLALYLLSFIVVFSPRGGRIVRAGYVLAPVAITLLWVPTSSAGAWPAIALVALELVAFAVVALALHGRLADDRPPASELTRFYLLISVGGVLGSAFVALVAPVVFKGIWELPILLVLALVALAMTGHVPGRAARSTPVDQAPAPGPLGGVRAAFASLTAGAPRRLAAYAVAAGLVILVLELQHSPALPVATNWLLVGGLLLVFTGRPAVHATLTGVVLVIAVLVLPATALFQDRGFFGVIRVEQTADGQIYELRNGTTVHGSQWRDPARAAHPINEFAPAGPAGDIFGAIRSGSAAPRAIGLVGLGAGELATYTAPGDTFTAFEINPLDVRVALDPAYFTYLSGAAAKADVRTGDGRLLIEAYPPSSFDLLFLDAFNSDSVPVHLLTTEAITSYLRSLQPGGVLAFHLSNRYYDLPPVVTTAVESLGLTPLVRTFKPSAEQAADRVAESTWLVATSDEAFLDELRAKGWTDPVRRAPPLTDDYPDVMRLLNIHW